MNFFDKIHETQITRGTSAAFEAFDAFVPLHRRLFPLEASQRPCEIARAAVLEVLG